jgi:hypothetical protein
MNQRAAHNARQLVMAGVRELQAAGWTEAQIIGALMILAGEAVKYLARKEAER